MLQGLRGMQSAPRLQASSSQRSVKNGLPDVRFMDGFLAPEGARARWEPQPTSNSTLDSTVKSLPLPLSNGCSASAAYVCHPLRQWRDLCEPQCLVQSLKAIGL